MYTARQVGRVWKWVGLRVFCSVALLIAVPFLIAAIWLMWTASETDAQFEARNRRERDGA